MPDYSMPFRNRAIDRISTRIENLEEKDKDLIQEHLTHVDGTSNYSKRKAKASLRKMNRIGPRIKRLKTRKKNKKK